MIKTKSIYDKNPNGNDGLRILIMRHHPRGVKKECYDYWLRELSPSKDLLKRYNEGKIMWDVFKPEFIAEIKYNPHAHKAIIWIRDKNKTQNITLLCKEKEGENCHRHIVKAIIEGRINLVIFPVV
jgi:uncharacterized protein YeaO (DUF488 family)